MIRAIRSALLGIIIYLINISIHANSSTFNYGHGKMSRKINLIRTEARNFARKCALSEYIWSTLSLSLLPRFFSLLPPPLSTLASVTRAQGVVGARLTRISGWFCRHSVPGPNACVRVSHHDDGMLGTACECVLITPLSLFVPRSLVSSPGYLELFLSSPPIPLVFLFPLPSPFLSVYVLSYFTLPHSVVLPHDTTCPLFFKLAPLMCCREHPGVESGSLSLQPCRPSRESSVLLKLIPASCTGSRLISRRHGSVSRARNDTQVVRLI